MSDIQRVIDGDTLKTDKDTLRVGYIDTPESVHPNDDLNTREGEQASDFAKDVLPKGQPVVTHDYGRDHFGRQVSGVNRVINGVEVDYGLVALDQQMSTYFTEYGEHPDPTKHDEYKEYYSKHVPYQFGTAEQPLTREQFNDMTAKHEQFRKTYTAFKEGDATQEEFDQVTADLYGDSGMVMRYRHQLSAWNRPIEMESEDTIRGAMRIAMEDPLIREQYNRAVRNGHLMDSPIPEKEATFWEKTSASFSMLSSVSNLTDMEMMWDSRRLGTDFDVPQAELVKGLPDQYHATVISEASEYNDQSALLLRDQLIDDIQNNRVFDNMEWYAQLGYGAAALIVDPLTLIPAVPIAKGGQAINAGVKTWTASRAIQNTALMSTWAAGGALEGSIVNAPRLSGDHTYTAKDYQLDILMDAGFGLGLGGLVEYAGKPFYSRYIKDARRSRQIEQEQIQNYVERREQPVEAATPELETIREQADVAKAENVTKAKVAQVTGTRFTPWEAITEVSPAGFTLASNTLVDVFPKDTAMRKLINSQIGLNRKKLTPEERVIANELNSDILHLASAFPDGNVPKGVAKSIEAVTFRQKTFKRNNALTDVLQGNTSTPARTLQGYVKMLRNHKELWEGYDPMPMSRGDFFAHQSDWMSMEGVANPDDVFNLTQGLPREISYLKDVVELNKMAAKMDDAEFTAVVEELNGLATTRMEQREFGDFRTYSDSTKRFGETAPMSPPEIAAQLKKEGLTPRTSAYSNRMQELRRHGRVSVGEEVNQLGRIDEFEVGRKITDPDLDSPDYYLIDDAKQELFELQRKPNPTPEDVARSKELISSIERTKKASETTLVKDNLEQDLLPRAYTEIQSQEAYKNPSAETLKELKNRLNQDILRKLGVKTIKGKAERAAQQQRLEQVKSALIKDKSKVIDRMVKAGKWQNVEDVIRASHAVAEQQKLVQRGGVETKVDTPLNEDELAVLTDRNSGETAPKVSDEEYANIQSKVNKAYEKMVEESAEGVSTRLADFVRTGEKKAFELARKPRGILDTAGRLAAKITEDLGTKFQNGKLTSLEYIGSRITEIGKGYGGAIRRRATGGVIRDAIYKESMMQVTPAYVRAMDAYALSKGKTAVGRMNAQQMAGADSKIVKQFNRDVFLIQEYRRQGKELPSNLDKSVIDFVGEWNKFMDYNHGKLVEANIGGFTKKRKVENYIPHVWQSGRLLSAINKHGEAKVEELFTRAYQSSSTNGVNPADSAKARELAKRQIDWIKRQGEESTDQFLPVSDSRAKQRLDLDTTTEFEGLSVMDLLDDEVISIATKYSNRMAGWVGLSKSTDGMLTSQLDIDSLKKNMIQEGVDKKISTKKYEQYYDDLMDLMFGRPTRGGLTQELRQLKDLTALTRMGGLGTAQLIETGQVITRSVLSTFSSEPVVKKVMKLTGKTDSDAELIREIQSISNVTDDLEWLDRQSVHLDQAELSKVNKARQLSLWVADKATFGSLKAPASRLLGKTTGYNAVRRAQSRITQASFTVDVAKHFKSGTGKMGNARMADVGLTDANGIDIELQDVFNNIVEYDKDGLPTKLNVEKWPRSAREKFQYALIRDEAQQIQRTHIGELPPWMNKPMMALVFQFRQMPIVANNKQLGRSLAFADKEAVVATMLNAAMSGLVRYSKFAALGLGVAAITDSEWQEPTEGQMQVDKYIAQFGIFPDARDLVMDAYQAGTTGDYRQLQGQVPVMGLMKDYYDSGFGEKREQIEAAQGLVPLGNTAYGDMIHTWLQETFQD